MNLLLLLPGRRLPPRPCLLCLSSQAQPQHIFICICFTASRETPFLYVSVWYHPPCRSPITSIKCGQKQAKSKKRKSELKRDEGGRKSEPMHFVPTVCVCVPAPFIPALPSTHPPLPTCSGVCLRHTNIRRRITPLQRSGRIFVCGSAHHTCCWQ